MSNSHFRKKISSLVARRVMRDIHAARAIGLKKLRQLHSMDGTFAILSAYRPLSKAENKARHGELLRDLQNLGYRKWYDAKGYWTHTEKSLLVPNMSFRDAIELGEKYDQDAIVYKSRDGIVGIYDLRTREVMLTGPDISMQDSPEGEITKFRNTGLTYDLIEDETLPFGNRPIRREDLETSGFLQRHPGV